jgi:hypothetical protein
MSRETERREPAGARFIDTGGPVYLTSIHGDQFGVSRRHFRPYLRNSITTQNRVTLFFDGTPIVSLRASGTIRRYSLRRAPRYIRESITINSILYRIREIDGGSTGNSAGGSHD